MLGAEQAIDAIVDTEIFPGECSLVEAMAQFTTDRPMPNYFGADARAKKTRSLEEFLALNGR
jgi:hypothetical protein